MRCAITLTPWLEEHDHLVLAVRYVRATNVFANRFIITGTTIRSRCNKVWDLYNKVPANWQRKAMAEHLDVWAKTDATSDWNHV